MICHYTFNQRSWNFSGACSWFWSLTINLSAESKNWIYFTVSDIALYSNLAYYCFSWFNWCWDELLLRYGGSSAAQATKLHKHSVSTDCIETEDDNYLFLINFVKNFIFCSRKRHAETRKRGENGVSQGLLFLLSLIFLGHNIKDGSFNSTNINNQLSPAQNTSALQAT